MKALLLVTSSFQSADFLYASKFWIDDPAIFIQVGQKKILAVSSYEVERAKKEAKVDEVIDVQAFSRVKGLKKPSLAPIISESQQDCGASGF